MDNIALFKGINEGGLDELLGYLCAETKVCKKNDIIWKKGEKISDIAIVLAGRVKFTGNSGDEIIYGFAGDNQIFGANVICRGEKIAPFNYVAVKQTGILFIPFKKIVTYDEKLEKWQGKLIKNLFEIVAEENFELQKRLFFLEKKSIREKVLSLLNAEAQSSSKKSFLLPFSRESMADYLCVDRSALSRELSNLQKDKIIEFRRNEFTLLK